MQSFQLKVCKDVFGYPTDPIAG